MNSLSTGSHIFTRLSSNSSLFKPYPQSYTVTENLGFCIPKSFRTSFPNSLRFRVFFKPPGSDFPVESQLSDADEEYDYDDEDDDVAADEYDDISGDLLDEVDQSDDETEISVVDDADASARPEESKWQRVEKLCNEVRQFGDEVIDVNELASIYDFRIDKFQVEISVCTRKESVYNFCAVF